MAAIFTALVAYIGLYFLVQWRYPIFVTPLKALVPVTRDGQSLTSHLGANILAVSQDFLYDASGHPPAVVREFLAEHRLQPVCPTGPGGVNTHNHCLAGNCTY